MFSIDRVKAELDRGKDTLTDWADNDLPSDFFLESKTQAVANQFAPLMQWVQDQDQFLPTAKSEFASADVADGWLIATAMVRGMTVVTHEKPNPEIKKRVPIPNVCQQFNVICTDTYEMLRDLNAMFVLKS